MTKQSNKIKEEVVFTIEVDTDRCEEIEFILNTANIDFEYTQFENMFAFTSATSFTEAVNAIKNENIEIY
jgi:hypothetical protein